MSIWIWCVFILAILGFILLDLGVFHRRTQVLTLGQSLAWTGIWIGMALGFNGLVYLMYEHGWSPTAVGERSLAGAEAAIQFFTAYILEKSLSLDNVFVIALIFGYFAIPLQHQHRLLFWGIIGAIVLRGVMIGAGTLLLGYFHWLTYVLGGLLVVTALRMFLTEEDQLHPERNLIIRLANRLFPTTTETASGRWLIKVDGRWTVTPLLLALLLIESSDIMFAVDSIPAVFGVTRDPFIVFTSNIFAILGLRSMYFVLAGAIQSFRYLKLSLVIVLAFVGLKMLCAEWIPISNLTSLIIVGTILGIGWLASAIARWKMARAAQPAFDPLAVPWAVRALRFGRRALILVVGGTVILIGVAMIVLPGPATLVIPFGLSILALEFMWARRWLEQLHKRLNRFLIKRSES